MNIIIAGAGKVGFNLARTLSIGHNVTIIDQNSEALHRIVESLDILPLRGDVEDAKTYENLSGKSIDLFIAVTNVDDVNLIASMVADTVLDIKRKFVRLQKEFFDGDKIKEKLVIEKLIFPLQIASKSIASLLEYPKANNVKFFKYTQEKLISVMVSSKFVPRSLTSAKFRIVGIERKKEFFIPRNSDVEIHPEDLVYFFGYEEEIKQVCTLLELETTNDIQNCVVFGGEELGVAIAKELVTAGRNVKLVEKDLELCEHADEELQGKVHIINSKYNAHDIYEEENLGNADIFIAASKNDEFNIIKCLEARESGIKKVVAINNEVEYYNLMHSLGIVVVRGPKMSAYNKIMEEISSTGVVIQKSFCGAKAVVFMRKVFMKSKLISSKVKPLAVKESLIFFLRNEHLHLFDEKLILEENDLIIAFCSAKESTRVKQWIYGL